MVFDPRYAYIECGFCGGKLQALKEYDYGVDVDREKLSEIAREHWGKCTTKKPWKDDPNAVY